MTRKPRAILAALAVTGIALAALGPAADGGVEPPRGTADRRRPRRRQHRRLRVRQPGRARHGDADRQLDPVRGAQRRPELLPVRRRRPRTTSTSTTTATPAPTSPTGGCSTTIDRDDRTRSSTTPARSRRSTTRTCNFRQTYDAGRDRSTASTTDACVNGRAGRRRRDVGHGVDARLRAAARPGGHRRRRRLASRSPARPTTRSSSTCGSSTCSTAATSSEVGQDTLAGYNVNTIALQVPQDGAGARAATPTRNPVDRRLEHDRPAQRQRRRRRPRPDDEFVQVSRLGNPLVNEVVIPLEPEGRVQRDLARTRTPTIRRSSTRSPTPSCPS